MNGRQDQIGFVELRAAGFGASGIGRVQCQLGQKTLADDVTGGNLLGLPGMFAPRYQECFAIGGPPKRFLVRLPAGQPPRVPFDHRPRQQRRAGPLLGP